MTSKGVWLGSGVIDFSLYHAGKKGLLENVGMCPFG